MLKALMNTFLTTREHILSSERHFTSSHRKQFPAHSLNRGVLSPLRRKELAQRSATVALYAAFRGGLTFDYGSQTNDRSDKL